MTFEKACKMLVDSSRPNVRPKIAVRKYWLSNKRIKFVYYESPNEIDRNIEILHGDITSFISQLGDYEPDIIKIGGHYNLYYDGFINVGYKFTPSERLDDQWLVLTIDEFLELFKSTYKEQVKKENDSDK